MKKMFVLKIGIFTLICLFSLRNFLCSSQITEQKCADGETCILLGRCRRLRKSKDQKKIRESTCGVQNDTLKVCCKSIFEFNPNKQFSQCGRQPIGDPKPGRGKSAPFGSYPWVAALAYKDQMGRNVEFKCFGSIINSRYVLTAAHCVDRNSRASSLLQLAAVYLGVLNLTEHKNCEINNQCFRRIIASGPQKIIQHPEYNKKAVFHADIALIKLNLTLDFGDRSALLEPVCLPTSHFTLNSSIGLQAVVSGWGKHRNTSIQSVVINVLNNDQCEQFSGFIDNEVCVAGQYGRDWNIGDSGGPAVVPTDDGPPFTQIGIISYGGSPVIIASPSVGTFVTDYMDWIIDNAQP